jgi:PAS domain S-box-containing protein
MDNPGHPLSNEQLLNVLSFSQDATAIHYTEDAIIQYANEAMLTFWGKGRSVIGKSLEEALPELKGQPFIDEFKKVWREGITINGVDAPAALVVDGRLQTFYFDYEYRAIKNEQGQTYCILHMARDVTERVLSREREQDLTEELRAANEELLAANEEMNASNEELTESRQQLFKLYEELSESDSRFRSMVKQAPIGLCIIRARDLFIQEANDAYLELVGKKRHELQNHTIWDAVPEAAAVYAPIMNNVINTGVPFIAKEHELILIRNGNPETVFVDFVYEPMQADEGVSAIMVLAIEVSDKVIARRGIEEVEERIRLAVESAEIGTFDLDYINKKVQCSERFNTIFGFNKHVSWETITAMIHPDDKAVRDAAYVDALKTGRLIYEARVIHPDHSIHWIRAHGKVFFNQEEPVRILGTVLDITEFKRLEQQKDDFISIASHELKTPITSLKASLQLLERLKGDPASPVMPKLIDQSIKSMHKVSSLVDDLLNVGRTKVSDLKLKKSTFLIADMLNACCNHIRVEGKYTLTIKGDTDLKIYADEHAIDQVVVNLVNNAVRYAPESLEIILMIEQKGDAIKISVTDTGPGIAPEKIPHLFDRYYQAQSAGFNKSGLGLGLYISSEIIRKHGGQIGVDSVLGNGSTFWFTLPISLN